MNIGAMELLAHSWTTAFPMAYPAFLIAFQNCLQKHKAKEKKFTTSNSCTCIPSSLAEFMSSCCISQFN